MSAFEPSPPSLRALALPAKDLARGLKHGLEQSRRLTAPMREALPDPVRDFARGVVAELEGLAGSAREAVGGGARRAGSLARIAAEADPALAFARAASFGFEVALARLGRADLMASETLAAVAWRSAGGTGPEAAARLVLALEQAHVAGLVPGTPLGIGTGEARVLRLAGAAVLLWMLVERDVRDDEAGLLGLCLDVIGTIEAEVLAAGAEDLARMLQQYADVV